MHLVVKGDLRVVLCCGPGPPPLFLVAYRSSCPAPPDPAAVLFQRLNDDVHSHVHEISMPELRLDDLLRLSKRVLSRRGVIQCEVQSVLPPAITRQSPMQPTSH